MRLVGGPAVHSVRAVFFVSVNQVLVRLWARLRSSSLTGKRDVMNPGCPMTAASTFRGVCGDARGCDAVGAPQCVRMARAMRVYASSKLVAYSG